ncbi:MAG: SurA N-terminal domain-containing protein [Deltaproteobacteria bacterium]|nr:SurA N-terminal domain-containing protein [Deltaproteobacteria bacterium]
MLSVFRSNANNWLMVIVLAAITFVFVFTFGSWGGGNVSGDLPIAATVNGEIVPMSQFRVQYAQTFRTQTMFRPGFSADKAREEGLDQQVLDRLITTELLAQAAEDRGLVVTDDEVADAIQTRFFEKGKPFDGDEYKRIVNGVYNTTEARFEEGLRKELMAQRLESILGDAQHVSDRELKETFESKNNRADLEILKIDPLFWKSKVKEPTADDVAAYTAAHKADIEKFYNEHMNRYRQSKKVNARHILIKVSEKASDDDKKKARTKIEAALKRVKAGEAAAIALKDPKLKPADKERLEKEAADTFAKVAEEVSEDSSAKQGGSLGLFGEGAMVKPFEDAAFALKKGDISDVVESKFGYHVIKVEEVQDATKKELAEVENDIAKQLAKENLQKTEARKVADEALAELKAGKTMLQLTNAIIQKPPVEGTPPPKPEDVDPYSPRVDNTGFFAKNARVVPRIGVSPEVVDLAFNKLSLEKPLHEEILDVNGRLFIVRLKGREQPDAAKFAAERDALEQTALQGRKAQVVEEFTKGLREKAKIEKNPKLLTAS